MRKYLTPVMAALGISEAAFVAVRLNVSLQVMAIDRKHAEAPKPTGLDNGYDDSWQRGIEAGGTERNVADLSDAWIDGLAKVLREEQD